jgi:hypothetical protein
VVDPVRWQLLDEYSGDFGEPHRIVAVCADVLGLYVDRPPRPRERYTLLGCRPGGALAAAVGAHDGPRHVRNVIVESTHDPDRPPPPGCDCASARCECMEVLLDVEVTAWRSSVHGDGLFDVDLAGWIDLDHRYANRDPSQRPDAIGFRLTTYEDEDLGECADIAGLFVERPEPPGVPAVLVGCRPEEPLLAALAALEADRRAERRRVTATLLAVAADGTAVSTLSGIFALVTGAQPSAVGPGLLDVAFDGPVIDPLPVGARPIWDLWYAGRPPERNMWADLDRSLRHEWSGAALSHFRQPDPDGGTRREFHLDGRFVTDIDGFYCAVGEAVNGPGGYFGWNLDALNDCLRGRWGAEPPFRLVWHDARIAARHLVPGYDHHRRADAVTMDELLEMFREYGVDVKLR